MDVTSHATEVAPPCPAAHYEGIAEDRPNLLSGWLSYEVEEIGRWKIAQRIRCILLMFKQAGLPGYVHAKSSEAGLGGSRRKFTWEWPASMIGNHRSCPGCSFFQLFLKYALMIRTSLSLALNPKGLKVISVFQKAIAFRDACGHLRFEAQGAAAKWCPVSLYTPPVKRRVWGHLGPCCQVRCSEGATIFIVLLYFRIIAVLNMLTILYYYSMLGCTCCWFIGAPRHIEWGKLGTPEKKPDEHDSNRFMSKGWLWSLDLQERATSETQGIASHGSMNGPMASRDCRR